MIVLIVPTILIATAFMLVDGLVVYMIFRLLTRHVSR